MKRFVRSVLHGAFLLLLLGLATPESSAGTPNAWTLEGVRSPGGAADAVSSSRGFRGVWYRTPEKRGKIAAWLASGDLTVGVDTISFESKKISLMIATASIRDVESTQFPDDPRNAWIVIKYDEGGSTRAAAFKGAGLGRETEVIRTAFVSTWLAGAPAPATAPGEKEIASAIEKLHTTRLESLRYSNSTVPKNVWMLVFTPGLDDALVRAYRAGDRDDLFRFNIIMILNRRAVTLEGEEARRKVYDCMIEAVRKDSFGWVKVEARDALRRLGAEKEVLQEADALIKSGGGTEAPPPPVPPVRPQSISTFAVEFKPAGEERFAATDVTTVKRYKTIAHWPGKPEWVSEAEVPSRPYVTVGHLHFPIAWHWLEKDVSQCPAHAGLVVHHVRAIGGDAILLCDVRELSRGVLQNPDTGEVGSVSYRELTLDVIRYTDR